jgi:calcineurin-like phosphoesterase family protein
MRHWFTGDTHFGHRTILKYCKNRKFNTVEEMDEALIKNINERVMHNDILYHIGDFAFATPEKYRERINCKQIVLIMGNHDPHQANGRPKPDFAKLFTDVFELLQVKIPIKGGSVPVTMCHYAMKTWNKSHYGAWHLHGHSHGNLAPYAGALSMDVGVDPCGLKPVSVDHVASVMATKTFIPVDHHKSEESDIPKSWNHRLADWLYTI